MNNKNKAQHTPGPWVQTELAQTEVVAIGDTMIATAREGLNGIVHSLLLDADAAGMSFNDWCDNFGYDSDCLKAFKTYQACCEIGVLLNKVFSREQQAAMREALQDF